MTGRRAAGSDSVDAACGCLTGARDERHVTKGMYLLVPGSSIRGEEPYTMAVKGPEFSLRR
jgi:hypothetical protein